MTHTTEQLFYRANQLGVVNIYTTLCDNNAEERIKSVLVTIRFQTSNSGYEIEPVSSNRGNLRDALKEAIRFAEQRLRQNIKRMQDLLCDGGSYTEHAP